MLTLQELRAAGMMALRLPCTLRRPGGGGIHGTHHVAERNVRYPVLLIHGYAGSESMWMPLRRALAEAGFGHIVSLSYNSFAADPGALSAELTRQALRAIAAAGAPRVHLIGHSLGGLIIRRALGASAALSSPVPRRRPAPAASWLPPDGTATAALTIRSPWGHMSSPKGRHRRRCSRP
jgi:pimeloyl-ACP methyl ester carboxylesterase